MSGIAVAEGGENVARKLENLMKEWKEKVATSVEVQRARDNLDLHQQKKNRLVEELEHLEAWEGELKAKRRRVEESLKPLLLQLFEKLEREEHVDDELLQEAFLSGTEEEFLILEGRVRKVRQLKRAALIQMVDLLFKLRHIVKEESLGRLKKMAQVVFRPYRFTQEILSGGGSGARTA